MWIVLSIRTRVYLLLAVLVMVSGVTTLFTVWYTYWMEGLFGNLVDKHLVALEVAEELESALVSQKGFVTYYFLDGDPNWLKELGEYRQIFKQRLDTAKKIAQDKKEQDALDHLSTEYEAYIQAKDRVIELYKAGERKEGAELHASVRNRFFRILNLSDEFKRLHKNQIVKEKEDALYENLHLRIMVTVAIATGFVILVLLAFFLIHHILRPMEELAATVDRDGTIHHADNMVIALRKGVHTLMEDVDQAQSELEKSRAHLMQTEKLALVGKLAAGMAHSIRNPFTSVKMRLFSLSRSLDLTLTQQEDFDVISEEIRHIDNIVQNFLEFSRPPKLKIQSVSPSQIVDQAIQLLSYRLKSYDVNVAVRRQGILPEIQGDLEQLKEVLVNIIVNACEAMRHGGEIVIEEEAEYQASRPSTAVIRLTDNGPGIPEAAKDKVFQPFFTTKEEGTGLGLSIAVRIIEEHQGWLDVKSKEGEGTTFIISLPLKGDQG
jgi:signal transduction histidine kinase